MDVRGWRPAALEELFSSLGSRRDRLVACSDELEAARSPQGWEGQAADAARGEYERLAERARRIVAEASAVRRGVAEAADGIVEVHRAIEEAESLARAHDFVVDEDGAVTDPHPPEVPADQVDDVTRERTAVRTEVADRLEQALRRAADIDADLAAVLSSAEQGQVDDGAATTTLQAAATSGASSGELSVVTPPRGGSPTDNAGWWNTLSAAERQAVLKQHPEWVGNRAGLPAGARDQANRVLLPREEERLQARARQLRADLADNVFGGLFTDADDELATVESKLASLHQIEQTIGREDRHLLRLDTSGERVKAATANGNVDTAEHVAVFTPGFTSNVHDSLAGYDRKMFALRREAGFQAAGGSESVATITWMGYEAPQTDEVLDFGEDSVLSTDSARQGSRALTDTLQGINASRETDPHLTAVGHSYGSLTTAYATERPTGVDDVVLFGQPGLPVDARHPQVADGHSYALEAEGDFVAGTPVFGPSPTHQPAQDRLGYTELATDESTLPGGRRLEASTGHTEYLLQDTTSQHNIAKVVAGSNENLIEDSGSADQPRLPGQPAAPRSGGHG